MKPIALNRVERAIEQALLRGEYVDVGRSEFERIAEAIAHRRHVYAGPGSHGRVRCVS